MSNLTDNQRNLSQKNNMRTRNRCQLLALVSLSAVLMIGCSSPKDGRSEGRTVDDKNITAEVKKSLKDEPAYKFSEVNVDTFAGVVQLSGFVETDGQKSRAEELAKSKSGVRGVANGILVTTTALEPTGRTNAVSSVIYSEPQHPVNPASH